MRVPSDTSTHPIGSIRRVLVDGMQDLALVGRLSTRAPERNLICGDVRNVFWRKPAFSSFFSIF